ncbi:MAG TPA: 4-phosphoerythronate dehydrogenase [Mariprofundaceae bacterium]|nr:4-phosphoerythronate dehydrogenase [Mariprofundaceae bacterium]
MSVQSLTIVADAHIWGVASAFALLPGFDVDLHVVESRDITHELLMDADILLTRSSTRVDADLLKGTPVRFVATATIGDDHYDKQWLEGNGIAWANAAGSSTGSVIEYMVTALFELHAQKRITIPETTLGIVGVGRIGSAFAAVCRAMGVELLLCDPPRERAEGGDAFSSIDRLLAEADIITLHTPLIREGMDKTLHLIDAAFLSRFRGRGIINAARGSCVDNSALADWLDEDADRFAVLDCWEHEPSVSRKLLAHPQMAIATPHIAGHSLDGKAANTQYAYNALCRYLNVKPAWDMEMALPLDPTVELAQSTSDTWSDAYAAATTLYPIMRDVEAMKGWAELNDAALAKSFTEYRRHYPVRRSWDFVEAEVSGGKLPKLIEMVVHVMRSHLLGSC